MPKEEKKINEKYLPQQSFFSSHRWISQIYRLKVERDFVRYTTKSCFLINYVYIFLELKEAQYIHWNGKILHMCENVNALISIKFEYLNVLIYQEISKSDYDFDIHCHCVMKYVFMSTDYHSWLITNKIPKSNSLLTQCMPLLTR